MEFVYQLTHTREKDEDNEDVKQIGIFATFEDAQNAQKKVEKQPGFRDYPDGFFIDKCKLGQIEWSEGFGIDWDTEE